MTREVSTFMYSHDFQFSRLYPKAVLKNLARTVHTSWIYMCREKDKNNMVDLGGYVIILVETKDKKIKLYGKF